jgi:succinate-semialdehyde dehydrogenase/glutarate-semialdehyde dehydrogenase
METLAAADIIEWFADEGLRVYGRIVPRAQPRRHADGAEGPGGPGGGLHAVELPDQPGGAQGRRRRWPPAARSWSRRRRRRPASPAALVRAFVDAGVPAGVIGLVYGTPAEISSYLIAHPVIRKITFTGSTPGGQAAGRAGRPAHEARDDGARRPRAGDRVRGRRRRAGGQGLGRAKFRNAGQVCISPTRFLVHESVRRRLRRRAGAPRSRAQGRRRPGRGHADGPAGQPAPRRGDGRAHAGRGGARRHRAAGGERIGSAGNFFAPTVLADVPLDARVFNDEPFGPVAAIRGFNTWTRRSPRPTACPSAWPATPSRAR